MEEFRNGLLSPPTVYQPRDLREAWNLKEQLGEDVVYISGGTLLRTQWEARTVSMPKYLIDLRNVSGLKEIMRNNNSLSIGSQVTLSECRKNDRLGSTAPAVQEALRNIAAPSIRNIATIGGNISSGYGDILPALLVYDTELTSFDGMVMSREPLADWLDSRWNNPFHRHRILTTIEIVPVPERELDISRIDIFQKIGRRDAFTASLVTIALTANMDAEQKILEVRIAAGGGSGQPQRLREAENILLGQVFEQSMLSSVYKAVVDGFETYSDPFATDSYKKKAAGNLIASELWKGLPL
ncbi:FAD binding domain-containing protein [Paenibacillus crassostreae]|uniref:FAD-binding PCMH-type domain-containing protein n=1 Tax=Paenibacillus crassostreae TaxID=1763538 RepID=A0A167B4W1_9BACL|nr:FAD binding domain-containing protein [Paenibacillus crassostreae]AOZ93165.1 hypothetical protein LPB68_13730 [Paenibacillus crassostreae]OAB71744.1 hypothetical protein PNBC_17160 [Paenibacillus crassostreae]